MAKQIGYIDPLYILAFDHRGTFKSKILEVDELSDKDIDTIKYLKKVIFRGFEEAVNRGLSKGNSAILVDEEYGSKIAVDAKNKGYMVAMPVEKSGQNVFDFEFGDDFGRHIEKFNIDFVKVLVRYNPVNIDDNYIQNKRLKTLSDYCIESSRKLIIELLIEPVARELDMDKYDFDTKVRPDLTVKSIEEIQSAGIEADIWKLEGYYSRDDYVKVVQVIRSSEHRKNVSLVVLGRGEGDEVVKEWIRKGKGVEGVIGFAVGRTIFAQAIKDLYKDKISEEDAIDIISLKYLEYYREFAG